MIDNKNKIILDSLGLPCLVSFEDLVKAIRLDSKLIYWLSSETENKYKTFEIPKKNGGVRIIHAPVYSLKQVQKWILCNIIYKIKTSPYSLGFKRSSNLGSPLYISAQNHKYNLYVLKLDLKDFYPSITKKTVYNLFLSIGYNSQIAFLLTNICTHHGALPQGAVTSAHLANLICRKMDYRLAGYCQKHDIVFTRYADDMAFSSDNRDTLKKAYKTICKIIKDEGFIVNDLKTRFMTPKCRKQILGITINDNQIKVSKDLKRKVRVMIHRSIATGEYNNNDVIKGYISYINSIEPGYLEKTKKYISELITNSPLELYPEIINQFNSNKIYSDLPNMELKEPSYFVESPYDTDYMNNEYELHQDYLEGIKCK